MHQATRWTIRRYGGCGVRLGWRSSSEMGRSCIPASVFQTGIRSARKLTATRDLLASSCTIPLARGHDVVVGTMGYGYASDISATRLFVAVPYPRPAVSVYREEGSNTQMCLIRFKEVGDCVYATTSGRVSYVSGLMYEIRRCFRSEDV